MIAAGRAAVVAVVALAASGPWTGAAAQWSGSVAVMTDYRYRGVSLSDGGPSARATLSYDGPRGWYAGASVAHVEPARGARGTELLAYAGRAGRLAGATTWEMGALGTRVSNRDDAGRTELYGGVAGLGWGARLYVAPRYGDDEARAAYAEANVSRPIGGPWHLQAHAGVLVRDGDRRAGERRSRADVRAGAGAAWGRYEVQLAWVGVQRERAYGHGGYGTAARGRRATLVVSAVAVF